jgi:hypothetical protein
VHSSSFLLNGKRHGKKSTHVSVVTLALRERRYLSLVEGTDCGAAAMENFSKRTTAIILVGFVLFGLGWGYGWQKVGAANATAVHCDLHSQHMTCTPVGKAG